MKDYMPQEGPSAEIREKGEKEGAAKGFELTIAPFLFPLHRLGSRRI